MCCTCSIICWSNTKRIFSVLIVFEKCFCLEKFQKLCKPVLATLPRESSKSQAPSHELTQKLLATLLQVKAPVTKKNLEKFKNFGFLGFLRLCLVTVSWVEAPVASLLRLFRDLLTSGPSNCKKTVRQIFQNLSNELLVTWIGDLFAAHSSREKRVFCALRVIFKAVFQNFSVLLHLLWLFVVSLFQTHRVYSQNLHFLHHLFTNLQEQGMGFLIFSKYFMFLAFDFLDFVFLLSFENIILNMVYGYFVEIDVWVLLVFGCDAYNTCSSCVLLIFE